MARYAGYDIFNSDSETILIELREAFTNNTIIEAEIISFNEGGFVIDYKGYPCFLPLSLSTHKCEPELDMNLFLNSTQKFMVKDLRNKGVILSRKAYLSDFYDKLELEELANIKSGESFTGSVKKVESYGVFLFKEYSIGMLHVNDILNIDFDNLPNEHKIKLKNIFREVFPKKATVSVIVDKIKEGKYNLLFDNSKVDTKIYLAAIHNLINTNQENQALKEELEKLKK